MDLGNAWVTDVWADDSWDATAWNSDIGTIGNAWANGAWASATWTQTSWYPALGADGGDLPRAKFLFKLTDLTVEEIAEGGTATGYTLPPVSFYMNVGELLDILKVLPAVVMDLSSHTPTVEQTGTVDPHTLDVVTFNIAMATGVDAGMVLPIVKAVFAPQNDQVLEITLPRVRFVVRSPLPTTEPSGYQADRLRLIRRSKGFLKMMTTKKKEELVDEQDIAQYDQQ